MINPWKSYRQKNVAKVIKIDAKTAYIPYITVQMPDGRTYEGSASRAHTQWERIKLGDLVRVFLQWSIVADKPMIEKLVRVRKESI
jgi:hypothetical protein